MWKIETSCSLLQRAVFSAPMQPAAALALAEHKMVCYKQYIYIDVHCECEPRLGEVMKL